MVNIMCLPPPNWEPKDRSTCLISGWGKQGSRSKPGMGGPVQGILLRHVPRPECICAIKSARNNTRYNTHITPNKLCFGFKQLDSCQAKYNILQFIFTLFRKTSFPRVLLNKWLCLYFIKQGTLVDRSFAKTMTEKADTNYSLQVDYNFKHPLLKTI